MGEIKINNNTIDRQAAIDAIESLDWYHQNQNKDMVHGANSSEHQPWYKSQDIYNAIQELPPAQQNRLERAVAGNSPEEIYDFLYWLMFDYARVFTDSREAVIAWLKGESNKE